jgi:acyl dehydratase
MSACEPTRIIDRRWIGYEPAPSVLELERGRLRFFAKVIGEPDPVYTDVQAAQDAGYPDLPAPPTFLFAAELDSGATSTLLADLGVPIENLLHGEQGFTYHSMAFAGDAVTVRSRVEEIYEKKNGALEFIVVSSRALNQRSELVAELRAVYVYRH